MTPHVAILIPSRGQRALANLARDAIAAFTEDVSHEVWSLDHDGADAWPSGSEANGAALEMMWAGLRGWFVQRPTHVFAMHDDALPLRTDWLAYLLSKPGPVTGVKASERNGYAHGSGVLFTSEFASSHSMLPDLPTRDAGEWPANWCASALCWRPETPDPISWVRAATPTYTSVPVNWDRWPWKFQCDLSFDDAGIPFYAHFGGGTLNHRPDREAWIAAARKALGL